MQDFAQLISNVESTTKTKQKVEFLKSYFLSADARDKVWAIALFTHKRPKRQINTTLLTTWAIEKVGMERWLFEESYNVVGDLSETLALILPESNLVEEKPLYLWIESLIELEGKEEAEKKKFVLDSWAKLDRYQLFIFHKLITGGFRIGISKNLIIRAIAEATNQDSTVIAHKLMGNWNPAEVSYSELVLENTGKENLSKPYPFYLAYPLEDEVKELGIPDDWVAEWKWDGIRSQLIKRGEESFLWSRGEELITDKFPDLLPIYEKLENGTVIDGELVAYAEGVPLPFSALQTRIGRKNVTKKQLSNAPAAIIAYDLLEYKGEDMREQSLKVRRELLSEVVEACNLEDRLILSDEVYFDDWTILSNLREKSRENNAEGFMLKRKDSDYKVGRKRGDWWKWKIDPFSIDAVMIYAQKGHGRRADIYSDYTFAVWSEGKLVPFAKAYSGLTDKEMLEITRFVKANTLERFGPVRTVTPEQVFEIHFEGISHSPRHKSGIAVRFPRINRWRKDKNARDANSLEDLKKLLNYKL